jgi:hypothetical protein
VRIGTRHNGSRSAHCRTLHASWRR